MNTGHTVMDSAALEALRGSIEKWEAIVAGTGHDEGADNCPLCLEFNPGLADVESDEDTFCAGCPVRERTGQPYCRDTPYDDHRLGRNETDRKAAAQRELDFLKSLLPKEAQE